MMNAIRQLIAWFCSWFRRPAPEPLPPGVIARKAILRFADGSTKTIYNVTLKTLEQETTFPVSIDPTTITTQNHAPLSEPPAPPQNRQYRRAEMRRTKWTTARDDLRPMRRRSRRSHWRVSCQDAWWDLRLKEREAQWAQAEAAVAAGIASFLLESAGSATGATSEHPARTFPLSTSATLRFRSIDPEVLKVFTG